MTLPTYNLLYTQREVVVEVQKLLGERSEVAKAGS